VVVGTNPSNTGGNASIAGTVFNDANGNGTFDPRENALTGVQMFIDLTGTGVFVLGTDPTATTDINGNYSFTNLPAGQYMVLEVAPAGFAVTSPISGSNTVTLTANHRRDGG